MSTVQLSTHLQPLASIQYFKNSTLYSPKNCFLKIRMKTTWQDNLQPSMKAFSEVEDFLANINNPTPNVSAIPSLAEEESLETYFPSNLPSCLANFENIPTEVHDATQEKTSNVGLIDFESPWHLGAPSPQPHAFTDVPKVAPEDIVASYIVPPPQPKIISNNLQTSVYSPVGNSFTLPVNTDKGIPLVIEVAPLPPYAPSRSQTVIKQGPALASRFPTRQIASVSERSPPRGKKVAKTNAERCQVYRSNQKTRREQQDEEQPEDEE